MQTLSSCNDDLLNETDPHECYAYMLCLHLSTVPVVTVYTVGISSVKGILWMNVKLPG